MGNPAAVFPQIEIWRAVSVTTFVSVGNASQPFSRLIEAVLKIVPQLPQPVVVQHGNTMIQGVGCVVKPFLEMDEFGQFIAKAELLILHAGAGSVIHAIQAGKIPVVMPRCAKYGEIVDDHQLEFARALAEMGKVVLAEKSDDLTDAVAEALRRQRVTRASNETPRVVGLIGAVLLKYARGLGR
jgi:UDP-N-acetylglucosamine transferase subunit ALG13